MLNKIHRLRSVGMDNGIATGFGILYVAEEAYPLIPYVRGNEHPLAFGRTPRLLSILFTTFVNTQNADYNGKTRTLTIGKDVRQVARRMGMLTGGCGRQNTVTSIIGYQDITFTSRDGKEIKPIEETNIVQGESWNEKNHYLHLGIRPIDVARTEGDSSFRRRRNQWRKPVLGSAGVRDALLSGAEGTVYQSK